MASAFNSIVGYLQNRSETKKTNKYNQEALDYKRYSDDMTRHVKNEKLILDTGFKFSEEARLNKAAKRDTEQMDIDLLSKIHANTKSMFDSTVKMRDATSDETARSGYAKDLVGFSGKMKDLNKRLEGRLNRRIESDQNGRGVVEGQNGSGGMSGQLDTRDIEHGTRTTRTNQTNQATVISGEDAQGRPTHTRYNPDGSISERKTGPMKRVEGAGVKETPWIPKTTGVTGRVKLPRRDNLDEITELQNQIKGVVSSVQGKIDKGRTDINIPRKKPISAASDPIEAPVTSPVPTTSKYNEPFMAKAGSQNKLIEEYQLWNSQNNNQRSFEEYLDMKATAGGYEATKPLADDYARNKMAGMVFKDKNESKNTYARFLEEYKRLSLEGYSDRELIKSYNKTMPDMQVKAHLSNENITIFDKMIDLINTGNVTGKGGQIKSGLAAWAEMFNEDPVSLKKYSQAQLYDKLVRVAVAPMRLQLVGGGQIVMAEHDIMKEVMGGKGANKSTALYLVKYFRQLGINSVDRYNFKADRANSIPGRTASHYPRIMRKNLTDGIDTGAKTNTSGNRKTIYSQQPQSNASNVAQPAMTNEQTVQQQIDAWISNN